MFFICLFEKLQSIFCYVYWNKAALIYFTKLSIPDSVTRGKSVCDLRTLHGRSSDIIRGHHCRRMCRGVHLRLGLLMDLFLQKAVDQDVDVALQFLQLLLQFFALALTKAQKYNKEPLVEGNGTKVVLNGLQPQSFILTSNCRAHCLGLLFGHQTKAPGRGFVYRGL